MIRIACLDIIGALATRLTHRRKGQCDEINVTTANELKGRVTHTCCVKNDAVA